MVDAARPAIPRQRTATVRTMSLLPLPEPDVCRREGRSYRPPERLSPEENAPKEDRASRVPVRSAVQRTLTAQESGLSRGGSA
jgi:hypothetical protein